MVVSIQFTVYTGVYISGLPCNAALSQSGQLHRDIAGQVGGGHFRALAASQRRAAAD